MEFYGEACAERPHVVWKNLHAYRYRNDLKKIDEVDNELIDENSLPRAILANHPSFFDYMFKLLDEEKDIAVEVWRMLNRLPASETIMQRIVNLEGIKGNSVP